MNHLLDNLNPGPNNRYALDSALLILMVLILVVLLGSLAGGLIVQGVSYVQGLDLREVTQNANKESPLRIRNFLRFINMVSHFMTFTVPPFVVIYFFYKRKTLQYFELNRRPLLSNISMALLFMVVAFPLTQLTYWLNQQVNLPEWAMEMETSASGLLESVLRMDSLPELLFNLLVVAVLPAFGEELLFRGVVQKQIERISSSAFAAVWITAFLFSAIHMQFAGFLPRMLLGAMLGYLFVWTRNLWIPIAGHFIFNSSQVVAQYFLDSDIQPEEAPQGDATIWISGIFSLAIVVVLGFYIRNANKARVQELKKEDQDILD